MGAGGAPFRGWCGMQVVLTLVYLLVVIPRVRSHIVQLQPGESECLYEEFSVELLLPGESETTVPTEVSLGFEVKRQKFGRQTIQNAIRINCTDPHGTLLMAKEEVREEEFRFFAQGVGRYQVCFSNGKPGPVPPTDKLNPKSVTKVDLLYFTPLHKQDDPTVILTPHGNEERRGARILDSGSLSVAHSVVLEMKAKTNLILQEQKHMKAREARHRKTVDSTSERTVLYACLETLAFASANLLQVFIVRRFFEVGQTGPTRGY